MSTTTSIQSSPNQVRAAMRCDGIAPETAEKIVKGYEKALEALSHEALLDWTLALFAHLPKEACQTRLVLLGASSEFSLACKGED